MLQLVAGTTVNIEFTGLYPKKAENKAAVGGILTQYRS